MLRKITTVFFLFITANLLAQEQMSVFFESNKFQLTKKEQNKLNQWILANNNNKIVAIHGFTDEDGTSGFNDTLAQKRVDFIFQIVKDQIKIRADFKTLSFGEKFNQSAIKAENRKVTIYYILEKDLPRENEILGIKPAAAVEELPKPEIEYPEKLVFENPNGTKSEFKLDRVFMNRVNSAKVGEKLKIENLNFIINTFAVVNESRGKMYELLLVLQNNPQLKIEIQGHLCCMPNDRLDLSTQRAKAIYNFLVSNQIYPARLSYKGFGSTQPIYPLPEKNESERAANRRVEILIVAN
ncbi:OmpA family protein [Flavobacterium sp. J49]|uniref:OmpA family protein n=1 Tax=Flavobacterium sp. J49 TaxID=2718534 RepID=UPI001592C554|nr:OmpA family protein [Flavobacterium sp. J49]MBF6640134.1 OmpA family protein [Flavobacterium sp. J49]NIC01379.1 OmpA family protein [Flavobacterium sp. J49]